MKYSSEHFEITKRFWDGTKEIEQNGQKVKVTLSLQTQVGREEAIQRAIKDLMARTLTRREETKEWDFNQAVKNVLLPKLKDWLEDDRTDFSEEAFDTWHAGSCKAVLDVLQEYYTNNDKDGSDVQYGKAQKIVNMTMKGLYCLKDAEKKNRYFEHCHIALDSFTLEWFKRNVIPWCGRDYNCWIKGLQEVSYTSQQGQLWLTNREGKQKKTVMREKLADCTPTDAEALTQYLRKTDKSVQPERIPEPYWTQLREVELSKVAAGGYFPADLTGSRMISWSVLPQLGGYHYGYDEYVRWIRVYFATNSTYTDEDAQKPLTAFQAEFYIWLEIQLELAAEAFYGQDIGKAEAVDEAQSKEGWPKQWKNDHMADKSLDEQFKWCKERFKEEPLENKMKYLNERIKKLNELFGNTEIAAQEVLQ